MVCTVVSIEDDLQISELLRVVLHSPGIQLYSVDNGDDGLALMREKQPDLVIMDIMMPGRTGWSVYDEIRADPVLKETPIIMLSVMREEPERRQAFARSEIDLYMNKPFDTLRLRRAVERMTGCQDLWAPPEPGVTKAFSAVANRNSNLDFLPPKPKTGEMPVLELVDGELDSPDAVLKVVSEMAELSGQTESDAEPSPAVAAQPEAAQAEAAIPDAPEAQAAQAEAAKPETATPEAAKPEAAKAGVKKTLEPKPSTAEKRTATSDAAEGTDTSPRAEAPSPIKPTTDPISTD